MGISIWQVLIILAIVLLLFGAKRLKNLGPDLGSAIKGFRQSMRDGEDEIAGGKLDTKDGGRVIDAEVSKHDKDKV
jgi:sec-independent protein translocase protein TatA